MSAIPFPVFSGGDKVPIPPVTVIPNPIDTWSVLMSTQLVYHRDGANGRGAGSGGASTLQPRGKDVSRDFMPENKKDVTCQDLSDLRQSAASSALANYKSQGNQVSVGRNYTIHFANGSEVYTYVTPYSTYASSIRTPGGACK